MDVENWSVYKNSKMSLFINLVKFHMESCIRTLVIRSCADFSDFLVKASQSVLDETTQKDTHFMTSKEANKEEKTHEIFLITLSISAEEGPYYTTPLRDFETLLREIYQAPIDECHRIMQLEPSLLTKFKFPKNYYIASLGFIEKEAVKPLNKFLSAIQAAVKPLQAFATKFEKYVDFYKLNVNEYVTAFAEMNHPAVIVRDEIAEQLANMEMLDREIPNSIVIGPFRVDITELKTLLVDKSRELYVGICTSFEDRLTDLMRDAMLTYEHLMAKLIETHTQVEKYMELTEKVDTIPDIVEEQDKHIRRMQQDYDVLDAFMFLLQEESFEVKYQALIWPYKIRKKVYEFIEKQGNELDRFKQMQIKDEVALQEKLSLIFSWFTQLAETIELEKVHETANEFRRAWKQLKEIDSFGELLNKRQDLLKVPVTPFDQTKELMKEFRMYKNFWTRASDFRTMFQQWTERPIKQLDLDNIETTFNQMYQVIVECEREFDNLDDMLNNVKAIKQEMETFRDYHLPILSILMNPNFQDEHWEEFGNAIGYKNFMISKKTSLGKFLKMDNVRDNLDLLKKINKRVNREWAMENMSGYLENLSPTESEAVMFGMESRGAGQQSGGTEHGEVKGKEQSEAREMEQEETGAELQEMSRMANEMEEQEMDEADELSIGIARSDMYL